MNRWTWMIALLWTAGVAASGHAGLAQENSSAPLVQVASDDVVPAVIRYSGVLPGQAQERVSVRFSVYEEAAGGSVLWTESQSVVPDKDGKYAVLLGSSSPNGLPKEVFTDGQARWLGIQVGGGEEQRSLLASVPFAMKAGDAATLAGRSAAEFVTTGQLQAQLHTQVAAEVAAQALTAKAAGAQPMTVVASPTGSGTTGYIPLWSSANTLADSVMYQTASSSGTRVGFGTTSPGSTIDVNGYATVRGGIQLQSNAGTASAGVNSPTLDLIGSAYSSSSHAAVPQRFRWQVDVSGNDTASPSANLVLGYGTTSASATGLSISPKGIITFATGQTFPGLAGGNGTTVNAASYDLGGTVFDSGSALQANAFLGFSGNGSVASSSNYNTGAGFEALYSLTTGQENSSLGAGSLSKNTTGNSNTAVGFYALDYNSSGSNNTAVGVEALEFGAAGNANTAVGVQAGPSYSNGNLSNATAIGAYATVSQSNSLVLGQTSDGNPGASHVNVGIGTSVPAATMEISVNAPNTIGPTLLLSNPGGTTVSGQASAASIDFKTYLHTSTKNSPTSRIEAVDDNYGNQLVFQAKIPGSDSNPLANAMTLQSGPGGWNTFDNPLIVNYYNGVPDNRPAAQFGGDISVDGTVSADAKDFKIDHPSDPANKYLVHTSVESSEMVNIYSGNATTDELGMAVVTLPDWFEDENGDFRYQLTTIGRDAHAWVSQEVSHHQFKIATNATFVKVSWQITAVRQDAYAKAHPLVVEQQKPAQERGFYRHPELYGQPKEKSIQWAQHSKQMQRTQLAAGTAVAKARQQ